MAGVVALGMTAVALRGLAKTKEEENLHKLQEAMTDLPPPRPQRFPNKTLWGMVGDITNWGGLELPIEKESTTATWYTKFGASTKGGARV